MNFEAMPELQLALGLPGGPLRDGDPPVSLYIGFKRSGWL